MREEALERVRATQHIDRRLGRPVSARPDLVPTFGIVQRRHSNAAKQPRRAG